MLVIYSWLHQKIYNCLNGSFIIELFIISINNDSVTERNIRKISVNILPAGAID